MNLHCIQVDSHAVHGNVHNLWEPYTIPAAQAIPLGFPYPKHPVILYGFVEDWVVVSVE